MTHFLINTFTYSVNTSISGHSSFNDDKKKLKCQQTRLCYFWYKIGNAQLTTM